MKATTEYFVAYADARYNRIRIVQCLLKHKPVDLESHDRLEFQGFEKLADRDDYFNLFLYLPAVALQGVEKISIVRLLEERELNEPSLIHSPVLVTAVSANDPSSTLNDRVDLMRALLREGLGREPKVTHEMIPEQYMPAHLVDSKITNTEPEAHTNEQANQTMKP